MERLKGKITWLVVGYCQSLNVHVGGGFKSTYYIIEINRRINRKGEREGAGKGGRKKGREGERERRKKCMWENSSGANNFSRGKENS